MDINTILHWCPELYRSGFNIIETEYNLDDFNSFAFSLDVYNMWCGYGTPSWYNGKTNIRPSIENYIKYYKKYGYEIDDNSFLEIGYEKIILYMYGDIVTHASKQFGDMWRSKLGAHNIIEHKLSWIAGYDYKNYGHVRVRMKRKNKQ